MKRVAITLLAAALLVACGSTKQEKKRASAARSVRIDVELIARDVADEVQETARRITAETEDRGLRVLMIKWQLNTLDFIQRAMRRPDPRVAFVDVWLLVAQTRVYVESDEGTELLGPHRVIVIDGLARATTRLKRRASAYLDAERLLEIETAIEKYAAKEVADGTEIAHPGRADASDQGILSVIASVPQGIFSLGGGVKDTAVSISEVADATRNGVEVVGSIPQRVRWQAELLLYSIEENRSVQRLLQDLSRVSAAAESVGRSVDEMPGKVEQSTIRAVNRLEETQPAFQKTLREGRGVVADTRDAVKEARAAIGDVDPLLAKIETATGRATEAGVAWEKVFEQLNLLAGSNKPPPPEPSPPFDMKDVVKTAEQATQTAQSVRAAVEDLRAVVEGEAADRRVASIEASTTAAIDRLTRAGVIVILTFFAALLVYRALTRWVVVKRT